MKKRIILLSLALLGILSVNAQTILVGDMNDDNVLDVSDVAASVSTILGQTEERHHTCTGVDNSPVMGSWVSLTEGQLLLNEDGTTNVGTGYTYKYLPSTKLMVVYNADGEPASIYYVPTLESNHMQLSLNGTETALDYYRGEFITGITMSETTVNCVVADIGHTHQLSATVAPADAAMPALVWSSSDENVATVDATGLVDIKASGTVIITASATDGSGMTATCTINVPVPVSTITLNHTSLTLHLEDDNTGTLTATVAPSDASDASVTWSSSDESVATVTSDGVVTAVSPGTATITCTANDGSGVTATCTITIPILVSSITLDQTSVTLGLTSTSTKTCTLTATVVPSDASDASVTWSSSDESVATVTSDGVVTAVSPGTATITCTANDGSGVTATCTITVLTPVSSITLNKTSLTLGLTGTNTYTLTSTVAPSDASDTSVTWSSSDESVATVTSDGVVTSVGYGTAVISCTANDGSGVAGTCTVKVTTMHNGHEFVDLGITDDEGNTVYFATTNVGATTAEDFGDYFAWGETTGYNSSKKRFVWESYTMGNGTDSTLTKYCTSSSYGTVDNKTTLELTDDAAHANWGGDWRMPTDAEMTKLRTNCTWTWTTLNDVNGCLVESTNGNSIFLPAAGLHTNSYLASEYDYGYYWTSSLYSDDDSGYVVYFSSSNVKRGGANRYNGLSIRPVLTVQN